MSDTTLEHEAQILSLATGLRARACERWMRHAGIGHLRDLRQLWPGTTFEEARRRAAEAIEDFILAS